MALCQIDISANEYLEEVMPMDPSAIMLTLIVLLMCASTMLWRKCMDENQTSAVWREKWNINVGKFSVVESENAPKFWAEFCTIIAVVLLTLLIVGDIDRFIPGKGWMVLAWIAGAVIITAIPYFCAKGMKMKTEGR